jgi:hypothetical protein
VTGGRRAACALPSQLGCGASWDRGGAARNAAAPLEDQLRRPLRIGRGASRGDGGASRCREQ